MRKLSKAASLFLTIIMLATFAVPAFAESAADSEGSTPLVVGYSQFSQKFSPFVNETGYDRDVADMTQVGLMTTDRVGAIVFNAIEGETIPYNGVDYTYKGAADLSVQYDSGTDITTYTAKIRDDLVFSDGTPATIDDVIFTYYTYLDKNYVGAASLRSYDIIGLDSYNLQLPQDVYEKYTAMYSGIVEAGKDHEWSEDDAWTQEQQDAFWAAVKVAWVAELEGLVNYINTNYLNDTYAEFIGATVDEISASEGLQVAFGMALWGFGELLEDGTFTDGTNVWTLADDDFPTVEDYYEATYAAYDGDAVSFWETETYNSDGASVLDNARLIFIDEASAQGEGEFEPITSISGIQKIDDYTVQIQTNGFEAPAIYSILGVQITPLHYYGDAEQYDYEAGNYGFPHGDLSIMLSKTSEPMGAGPYKFVKYENNIVYFESNELYYKGAPKTEFIQFKETDTKDVAPGIKTGTIDVGELSGSRSNFELVAGYNSNNELTGDVVTTSLVDNLGYGYIGISAKTVNVGGDNFSDASKNLRKALGTVLSVYRDIAIDSFYGDAASVINYPISNTSWAAPQPTDDDYMVAFSVDVEGNPIYTADMTAEEKNAAAIEAAKGFLIAAGYTFDEASGKFTAAPEGAKLEYELIIPGDGSGDHPSFAIVTDASNALAEIGITLRINDPADANILWDTLDAAAQELWCAAWGATIDPDMFQLYHSSNLPGLGGTNSNHYHLDIAELDQAIMDGRKSDDQAYRKAIYKKALDIIVDAAVEIPAYQRQNSIIFSTERVDMSTITPDITTFWGWMNDIQLIEMYANK